MEPAGEEVLGEAHEEDDVEVEPDGVGDGGDQHALAEPADAGEGGLQLDAEGLLEGVERGWHARGVEGGQAPERPLDDSGGVLLLEREAVVAVRRDEVVEQPERPRTELLPGRQGCGVGEPRLQLGHEVAQRLSGVAVARGALAGRLVLRLLGFLLLVLHVGGETDVPVRAGHHAGLAGDALPAGDTDALAVEGGRADLAQHPQDVGATEPGASGLEQPEHQA